ncbi:MULTISPECIES: AMP-binding protein [Actinoalloteichus]|uniref:Acyl-CoA synthetase (AMP-forming)/AMP-acid ligase II n=1 Tax=Actinoalloteichus fjordicus TaxID=1612552 RepID=A0AAC9LA25_9PSEU|nr:MULTISPECIES: AMP-binding protein [Actinoalloteichus]APU13119.1 acyl-CoA synthetase (AMP-forming)/AMP-acid ligase II [Actinoalloteichus fjordicus]APU19070.1 acyl-CoA synthetase (AMP-forming)/AMP-acid ligase II [Actinoalloteichus sp. GBA129-24]
MRTLHSWFTATADRLPDEIALVVAGQQWTYVELDRVARRVASIVADTVPRRPARVGLLAARSVGAYAGYLGVVRGGNAVVPMHVDYPAESNRQVVEVAELDALIVDDGRDLEFASGFDLPIIEVGSEDARRLSEERVADAVEDAEDPEDIAYILFTSGSTGVPKGVPIRHRNLDAFVRYQLDRYGIGPGCRMSQTFGLTFDPSVFVMAVAWGSGATLVAPSRAELVDPVGFVNDHAVTHWYSVPSIVSWVHDAGSLEPGSLPTLRRSLFAGEQLTLEQARVWSDAAPNSTIENLYGPTESTITVTTYQLPADRAAWPQTENATVPIGPVYPHLEYRIDPLTGELQVRGPQRFDGYLDPADNAGRFWDPDAACDAGLVGSAAWYRTGDRVADIDGDLVHLGRLDDQVKIMGRRLELGDVEAALRQWAGVGDVVVVAGPGPTEDLQLTAVYTGVAVDAGELRRRLFPNVPSHMIPARFVHVEALPLNANGKIDRKACRAL